MHLVCTFLKLRTSVVVDLGFWWALRPKKQSARLTGLQSYQRVAEERRLARLSCAFTHKLLWARWSGQRLHSLGGSCVWLILIIVADAVHRQSKNPNVRNAPLKKKAQWLIQKNPMAAFNSNLVWLSFSAIVYINWFASLTWPLDKRRVI